MSKNFWDELMGTDEGAASYMETYGEGPGCETRMIVGSFIEDHETVLDVGCGPGWNYDHFMQYGPDVYRYKGVDYSPRFIKVAKERWPGAKFEVQDCRKLKEEDNSWDVVILQDVLEHTNGYEKPIAEAMRVANNRVIICLWRPFNTNGQDDINDDGNDGYGATYDKDKFIKYIESFGYPVFDTETSPKANRWHAYFVIEKGEEL